MNICPNCGGDIDALKEMFPDGWTTCKELTEEVGMKILSDEEIGEKLDNDWDGLDQLSLVRFVQKYTLRQVSERLEAIKIDPHDFSIGCHRCGGEIGVSGEVGMGVKMAIRTIKALLEAGNGS